MTKSLAMMLAEQMDPVIFSRNSGITPDPWQETVLRSESKRIILNVSRQAGKSQTAATKAVHRALFHAPSLILLISRAQRQSGELFRKCLDVFEGCDRPVEAERESVLQIELANGSRIISLPGKEETLRSYSAVDLLIIDEASRVLDDLYRSVRPMLAVSNGTIMVMSTPHGKRGFFWDIWDNQTRAVDAGRRPVWEMYKVSAKECPRITEEFLEDERNEIGDWYYRQEYENAFLDSEDSLFRQEDIEATYSDDVEEWGGLKYGEEFVDPQGDDDPVQWDLSA